MFLPDFQTIQKVIHLVFLNSAFSKTCIHLLEVSIQSNLKIWLSKANETVCRVTVKCVVGNFAESGP